MMRVLLAGGHGMLGTDLARRLPGATVLGRTDLDITDADAARTAVEGHDVVINCAAYTAVDAAETDEREATRVNGTGAGTLAGAAEAAGARFVQISTDYVFAGDADQPYPESAPLDPRNAYGRSKAAGERLVQEATGGRAWIVRTAWLYGRYGTSFPTTILRLVRERGAVDVVADQVGQPTWTGDLATRVVELIRSGAPGGIYHGTNSGAATWYDFACATLTEAGLDASAITPTTSAAFPRPAARPAYSVLGHDGWSRAGLPPMRPWRDALRAAVADGLLEAA